MDTSGRSESRTVFEFLVLIGFVFLCLFNWEGFLRVSLGFFFPFFIAI